MTRKGKLVCMLLLLLLGISGGSVQAQDTVSVNVTVQYGQTDARQLLNMVNEFRTGSSAWYWNADDTTKTEYAPGELRPLVYDYDLERAAMQRAVEIAVLYSHTRPSGESCFTAFDSKNTWAGENIAAGYISAGEVFAGWQEGSEKYSGQGHRRSMLSDRYTAMGAAQVYFNGYYFWVMEFRGWTGSTTATAPAEEIVTVPVELLLSYIKEVELTPSEETLDIPYQQEVPLPKILTEIRMERPAGEKVEGTWPSYEQAPVMVPYIWQLNGSGIAEFSQNGITGRQVGETSLSAQILGRTVSVPAEVTPLEVDAADISLSASSVTYNGTAQQPQIQAVTLEETVLRPGVDYDVVYSNNINAGTAGIKITGKGNYTGSQETEFQIQKASISSFTIHQPADQIYNSSPMIPEVTVSSPTSDLQKNIDYSVTYTGNLKVGKATVTAKGTGNYSGSCKTTFQILPAALTACKITGIGDQIYNGSARKPAVKVTFGSSTLKSGTDYTVSYQNNVKVGKATVTITGKGNFNGSVKKTFQIKKPLSPKKGTSLTDKKTNGYYKITKAGTSGTAEAAYIRPISKTRSSVTIPDTITVNNVTYKVTSIAAGALRGNTKITKLVIGKNVGSIGAQAFYNCKKLKSITIKTSKLSTGKVGTRAFGGIYRKAVVKVPSAKVTSYRKLLKARGAGAGVKVKR